MNARRFLQAWIGVALFVLLLTACAPAPTLAPTQPPAPTGPPPTQAPAATPTQPAATPVQIPTEAATVVPTEPPAVEERAVEVEWPPQMRLGDSDLVRLALIPSTDGYVVTTEFPDHQTVTTTVPVLRPGGYDLFGVARLDAVGFSFSPEGEQAQALVAGAPATWRWTIKPLSAGQHRFFLTLALRWIPQAGNPNPARETVLYDKGVTVQVISFFGLTAREAVTTGVLGLAFGGTLGVPLAVYLLRPPRKVLQALNPNTALVVEPHPGFKLTMHELNLLRVLFRRYARLVLEAEFSSGYSGARTFLAVPIHADGRADASTIAKIGESTAIQREFDNFQTFVKDTLPPITARIQDTPVTLPSPVAVFPARKGRGGERPREGRAALRYTFIGEPGISPASLRQALLAGPDPSLLEKLFSTFGPNWWMQRRPYTFRLMQEYDRLLPAHYVLEPIGEKEREKRTERKVLDGRTAPSDVNVCVGDRVTLRHVTVVERRADGRSWSLSGDAQRGQPPLRFRWVSLKRPGGSAARVVATRETLLRQWVAGFNLRGLPDPLAQLPGLLNEKVSGTQSTIHGDLNLENILIGPGGFVWLIDFAQTRDGHPLFDFAHLEAEIIAHVIAPHIGSDHEFVALLRAGTHPLLEALHSIANRCLFNPSQPREYHLALCMACLGALKFVNLDQLQKRRLYLAAAHVGQSL